ncbi:MAG: hypothetical protein ACR2NU_01375 [Aeoliella sp.]
MCLIIVVVQQYRLLGQRDREFREKSAVSQKLQQQLQQTLQPQFLLDFDTNEVVDLSDPDDPLPNVPAHSKWMAKKGDQTLTIEFDTWLKSAYTNWTDPNSSRHCLCDLKWTPRRGMKNEVDLDLATQRMTFYTGGYRDRPYGHGILINEQLLYLNIRIGEELRVNTVLKKTE